MQRCPVEGKVTGMPDQNFFLSKTLFRQFERKHLSFIGSLEDLDLIWAIGYAQHSGHPVGLKELVLADFGSPKTLQRRLDRLRDRGAVLHRRCSADGRRIEFFLSGETTRLLHAYKSFIVENGMVSRDPLLGTLITRTAGGEAQASRFSPP